MRASEYRELVRIMVKNTLNKRFPSLNKNALNEAANVVALNIHARFYGANVDNVDSPLWRASGEFKAPDVDAIEILGKGAIE